MASVATLFLLFLCFVSFLFNNIEAQNRAPHGLAYESPMVFSPSAFDFFHPNAQGPKSDSPCEESDCAPLPLSSSTSATAATGVAKSSLAHESKLDDTTQRSKSGIGAGAIAGIVFGFVLVVFLAMGVYYVAVTRKANAIRANSVQPDA